MPTNLVVLLLFQSIAVHSDFIEVPTEPPETLSATPKCGQNEQTGKYKCVPYYNCDALTNTIVEYPEVDGSDYLNARVCVDDPVCPGRLEVCCRTQKEEEVESQHVETVELGFEPKCGLRKEWRVAVLTLDKEMVCGGSLLTPVAVLTAAHCVKNFLAQNLVVQVGSQEQSVAAIITNEHFLESTLYSDVAILILKRSLHEDGNVGTICIPTGETVLIKESCFLTGSNSSHSVLTMTNQECQELMRKPIGNEFILDQSFVCTNTACVGEGGDPLVCSDSSQRLYQIGITSWNVSCDSLAPTVYTNVSRYREWIYYKLTELGYKSSSYTAS